MGRNIIWTICAGLTVFFASCHDPAAVKNAVKNTDVVIHPKDAANFKQELESLNDSSRVQVVLPDSLPVVYATEDEVLNLENGIVLFGWPRCPWFRNAVEPLFEFAQEEHAAIYYLDIHDIRDTKELIEGSVSTTKEGSPGYYAILEKFDAVWNPYTILGVDSIKRISSPTVLFIEKGKGVHIVVSTVVSQTDPAVKLDSTQREELKARYRKYFTT
ncbi:hypothetical protein M8998_06780 [Sphingobacterium sp. lm-10]|uniref:hypothetical protein n=1 Tax=Sphingobacterium sp. lm-10 TaxID=2944904 RepID=UPI002020518C|nr:hypothetical protein [Sphingobacterium sp. lm-10]MCL7987638.1 hypothetical protein [Sphingobacterium sp. lm-10]